VPHGGLQEAVIGGPASRKRRTKRPVRPAPGVSEDVERPRRVTAGGVREGRRIAASIDAALATAGLGGGEDAVEQRARRRRGPDARSTRARVRCSYSGGTRFVVGGETGAGRPPLGAGRSPA
jgi:hypothetical protein